MVLIIMLLNKYFGALHLVKKQMCFISTNVTVRCT